MTDKNPYYSIQKALGERIEEVREFPTCPDMSLLIELWERMERDIMEVFGWPKPRPTTLAFRGGSFVTLEIDGAGNVVEPPPKCQKCGPILLCSEHMGRII